MVCRMADNRGLAFDKRRCAIFIIGRPKRALSAFRKLANGHVSCSIGTLDSERYAAVTRCFIKLLLFSRSHGLQYFFTFYSKQKGKQDFGYCRNRLEII